MTPATLRRQGRMRDRGEINDDVLRAIERELDLEDSRLEI